MFLCLMTKTKLFLRIKAHTFEQIYEFSQSDFNFSILKNSIITPPTGNLEDNSEGISFPQARSILTVVRGKFKQ